MARRAGSSWQGGGALGGLFLPGGGAGPACSYAAPPTPPDIFGSSVNGSGVFVGSATPPSWTAMLQTSIPADPDFSLFGSPPMDGSGGHHFGINNTVVTHGVPVTVDAWWIFDTLGPGGIPAVCMAQFRGSGSGVAGGQAFAAYSDDGATFADAVEITDAAAHAIGNLRHRYWALHFTQVVNGTMPFFWTGPEFVGVLFWGVV